jgi:Protein of unknown function (DUF1638)
MPMTDGQRPGLRQPLLGAAAFVITVGVSLGFCALFSAATLGSWVALLFIGAVPAQVVLALGLHLDYPAVLRRASQPVKGLLFVALAVIVSAIVSPLVLYGVGGGVTPPNPFAIMFLVETVPVTLALVLLFRCWPLTALSKHQGVVGAGTLVLAYVLSWAIFRVFFDFGFLKGSPAYLARLDPKGLFTAWDPVAFIVAFGAVLLCFVLFDFWPVSALALRRPVVARQPLFGLLSAGIVALVALAAWGLAVGLAGVDPVVFMARVPVVVIFGVFIVLTLFQGAGFARFKQPAKGVAMTATVIVAAAAMELLYGAAARLIVPGIPAGAPTYGLELWLATAMLGVTFPVIVAFCDGFGFWPLPRARGAAVAPDELTAGDAGVSLRLIACPAVLGELADGALTDVDCRHLEAKLHLNPERLKEGLRAAVADADKPGATIVIGYGLCSNAVLGLKTEHATLVVPKVDDCIAMMLGSNAAFAAEAKKAPGTYYVAKSYLEECDTILSDHEKLIEKRGRERAEKMMRLLLANYTRIALIDTGRYDLAPYRARVVEFAERFDLAVEEVPGTTRILDALVAGGWGDDFVVAPAGHELTLRDFRPELFGDTADAP